jgi:tRNA-binding EMAP/Myf-like protein
LLDVHNLDVMQVVSLVEVPQSDKIQVVFVEVPDVVVMTNHKPVFSFSETVFLSKKIRFK